MGRSWAAGQLNGKDWWRVEVKGKVSRVIVGIVICGISGIIGLGVAGPERIKCGVACKGQAGKWTIIEIDRTLPAEVPI